MHDHGQGEGKAALAGALLLEVRDRTTRKAVARRAAEIGEGAWAAESVRRAVKAAHDAVVASPAAIVATTVATTS